LVIQEIFRVGADGCTMKKGTTIQPDGTKEEVDTYYSDNHESTIPGPDTECPLCRLHVWRMAEQYDDVQLSNVGSPLGNDPVIYQGAKVEASGKGCLFENARKALGGTPGTAATLSQSTNLRVTVPPSSHPASWYFEYWWAVPCGRQLPTPPVPTPPPQPRNPAITPEESQPLTPFRKGEVTWTEDGILYYRGSPGITPTTPPNSKTSPAR
jgi:hypothetical protein